MIKTRLGRSVKWKVCLKCNALLKRSDKRRFANLPVEYKGYCSLCHKKYLLNSSRINPDGNFRCSKCKEYLPANNFHKSNRTWGINGVCKGCINTGKKRGPKAKYEKCSMCGEVMEYNDRRVAHSRGVDGVCSRCYHKYLSSSVKRWDGKYRCCKCKNYFSVKKFNKDSSRKYGIGCRCKKCDYEMSSKYLKNNPEKLKGYIEKHRDKRMAYKRELSQRERDSVDEKYARRLLARYSDLSENEFPKEIVGIKIAEIKLYRALHPKKENSLPVA